jgi:transcriptional/translational regulatory protein YebC/TACO1
VLRDRKIVIESAELVHEPLMLVAVDEETGQKLSKLVEALEELDDVQQVFTNMELPQSLLEKM